MSDATTAVDVTIRVDKEQAHRFDDVVRQLEAEGLASVEPHARFLMVNGSIAPDRLDRLRGVRGVASVRRDATYKTQAAR